jgi:light-regulated signal transduction histidine kinase (bacteriophytochrome)
MIKTIVKVRGSTTGIRNQYSINSFYYSTRNHTQRRFRSHGLSLIVHYKFLT